MSTKFLITHGNNVLGTTTGVNDLHQFLTEKFPFKLEADGQVSIPGLDAVRVFALKSDMVVQPIEDVDLSDLYVTVPSFTKLGPVYSVAVNYLPHMKAQVVACSCPAFEFKQDLGPCKHMFDVTLNPTYYGVLGVNVGV